jgi:branched-subunit amino acid aminotransferase/4-amino-4-deoxychorismate lyase
MKEIIFLNGKFLNTKEAKLSVLTPGFLNGLGLFETMRSYYNKIVYLREHLERMRDSSKIIGIEFSYTFKQLKEAIAKLIRINHLKDAYVRMTLWKSMQGSDLLIIARNYRPYPQKKYQKGFSVTVSRFQQFENSFFVHLKSINRILYQLSLQEARCKGFDEAIILNSRGYLAEGSRSNIFFIKDRDVFTPALECGCLNGITRQVIFALAKRQNLKIYEGNFILRDLCQADEAFLTNSLMGVMPLASVEKIIIGHRKCRRLTKFFLKSYRSLLK